MTDEIEAEVLSLMRIWRECPKDQRPSIEALIDRVTVALLCLDKPPGVAGEENSGSTNRPRTPDDPA